MDSPSSLFSFDRYASVQKLMLLNQASKHVNCSPCVIEYINAWFGTFRKKVRTPYENPFYTSDIEDFYWRFRSSLTLSTLVALLLWFDDDTKKNTTSDKKERAYLISFIEDLIETVFNDHVIDESLKNLLEMSIFGAITKKDINVTTQ